MPLVKGTGWTESAEGCRCWLLSPSVPAVRRLGSHAAWFFPTSGQAALLERIVTRAILHFLSSPSFVAASESPLLGPEGEGSAKSILVGLVSLSLHVTSNFSHFF